MKKKKLSPKQQLFVHEYLIDLNATQAAIRAGYSEKTANPQAARLLANVSIKQAIEKLNKKVLDEKETEQKEIVEGYRRIAFFDLRKLYRKDGSMKDPHEWDDETARVVSSVETVSIGGKKSKITHTQKVKICDRLK